MVEMTSRPGEGADSSAFRLAALAVAERRGCWDFHRVSPAVAPGESGWKVYRVAPTPFQEAGA